MPQLIAAPEALASAATELESIRRGLDAARAAAAAGTTELLAAGADEISTAVTALFAQCGNDFQQACARAGALQQQFARTLGAAAETYLAAESLNALAVSPATAANATLIMGGTGNGVPGAAYLDYVYNAYIAPLIAPATAIPTGLTTPQQGWPLTGLHSLTFDTSVAQGVQILRQAIAAQPSGTHTTVFGFSQSATIISEYLKGVAGGSIPAPAISDVSFVLTGNPNNPNGGLFQRFAGLYLPGFNETFSGATPDLGYQTSVYTIQYDGYAHFPRYPLNILADLNALAGIYYGHLSPTPSYLTLTPEQIASAVVAPVSPGATGNTTYYMIPSQDLPLLRPFNLPEPVLNLVQPPLRVLIDMGYGDIGGPNTEYANLPTPASLFHVVNPFAVGHYLIQGVAQGVQADLVWAGVLPESAMPNTYPFVPSLNPGLSINLGQPDTTLVSLVTGGAGTLLRLLPIPPFGAG